MEILRFGGGRMKITLTREELAAYNIDFKDEESGKEAAVRALKTVEALAKGELPQKERCIRIYPCPDGSCDFFVYEKSPLLLDAPRAKASGKPLLGSYVCTFTGRDQARAVYEALACRSDHAALFTIPGKECYFLVCSATEQTLSFLEEYGRKTSFDPVPYLIEHYNALQISR